VLHIASEATGGGGPEEVRRAFFALRDTSAITSEAGAWNP